MIQYMFIAGYPRSGSTILASLLRQNPRFHAGILSPMGPLTMALQNQFAPANEAHTFYTEEDRLRLFRGVFDLYYETTKKPVIFDMNRRWAACSELIHYVFPDSYMICCVRPVREVLNSFERLFRTNLGPSSIASSDVSGTVYDRCANLMQSNNAVGFAVRAVAQAYAGPARDRLLFIEYADLVRQPQRVLDWIHDKIGEERFTYDPNHLEQIPGAAEFDESLGAPGLHLVEPVLRPPTTVNYLPSDIDVGPTKPFWRIKKDATTPR